MTSPLHSGIEQVIDKIEKAEEKPVLVAVYGPANEEKSKVVQQILDYFSVRNSPYFSRNLPDKSLVRDIEAQGFDIYIFQCNGKRSPDYDPNPIVKKYLNRELNLNVLVYNPQQHQKPPGEYDLIICTEQKPNQTEKISLNQENNVNSEVNFLKK